MARPPKRISARSLRAKPRKSATSLHYQPGDEDIAPVIAAQGEGELALQLIAMAKKNGIPIKEDADLATLLAAAAIGEEIPIEAFLVVAEIFRYLYQEQGKHAPAVSGDPSPYWQGNSAEQNK